MKIVKYKPRPALTSAGADLRGANLYDADLTTIGARMKYKIEPGQIYPAHPATSTMQIWS